jgi:hypothetical protein
LRLSSCIVPRPKSDLSGHPAGNVSPVFNRQGRTFFRGHYSFTSSRS